MTIFYEKAKYVHTFKRVEKMSNLLSQTKIRTYAYETLNFFSDLYQSRQAILRENINKKFSPGKISAQCESS